MLIHNIQEKHCKTSLHNLIKIVKFHRFIRLLQHLNIYNIVMDFSKLHKIWYFFVDNNKKI